MALIFIALSIVGCSTESDDIDPFAVRYDASTGPVIVTISRGEDGTRVPAIVDVLSPITILDTFEMDMPLPTQTRRAGELVLHGQTTGGSTVKRFRFPNTDIFDIHPCGVDELDFCRVGENATTRSIQGVLGTDVLSDHALRIDFASSELFMFPDIAGDTASRGEVCDAVFPRPYSGGGTLLIGGAEVNYTGGRLALGVCADFDVNVGVDDEVPVYDGVDMLLLLTTAMVPTMISESAYVRYQSSTVGSAMPPLADLASTTVHLPSGPISGKAATLQRLALVGEANDRRGPCREQFANYMMIGDECTTRTSVSDAVCPCTSGRFCRAGAVVEINSTIDVIVVNDLHPMLQALRNELRPDLAEADGLLGVGALSEVTIDLDYPNNRMLARCSEGATSCTARPEVRNRSSLLAPTSLCFP